MNNQQPRPVVAPSEYERNRAAISNYRQYLDMYEKLNEQGLKNHEEVERIEMLLQQRIQAGEEAKRQMELLKQTAGRLRLTNGQLLVPDLTAIPPSTQPVALTTPPASSSSAYIEEVHQEQVPPSTSSYRPYATHPNNSSYTPQSSHVRQSYSVISQNAQRHNEQIHQNAPTSHPQAQPVIKVTPDLGQQSQQSQSFRYYRPHVQQQQSHSQPAQNFTLAQSEYHHNFQGYGDHSRHTSSFHPIAVAALPHQASTQHQHNPPRRGSASHQQIQEKQSLVYGQAKATTQVVSSTKILEGSSISRPESSSSSTPTGTAKSAKVSSSLEGALGEVTASKTQPDVSVVPLSRSVVPPSESTGARLATDATRNSTSVIQLPPPPPAPSHVIPQPSPSFADKQHPPSTSSPSVPMSNQAPSPVRTPRQADKAHLARDLLRALKRPRPEASSPSVMEPEPKRHASDLAIKPTILSTQKSSLSVRMAQPTASTSSAVASTRNSSPSVQIIQPIASTSGAVTLPPPTPPPAPVAASTSTQMVSPEVPPQTTIPPAHSILSDPAHFSDASSGLDSHIFPIRSQIEQGTSSGHRSSSLLQYVGLPGAGFGQYQSSQINVPAKFIQDPKQKQVDAPAAQSLNMPSAREGPLVPQPGKVESHKPLAAVNLQGPSTAESFTVQPPPRQEPLFLPSPTSSPALGSVALAVEGSSASSSSASKENKEKIVSNLTSVKNGSKFFFAHVLVPPLPSWARKWKAQQSQAREVDELDGFENSEDVSRARSPSLGDSGGSSTSRSPSLAVKDVEVADGEESTTEEPEEEDQLFSNYDEAEQWMLHEHCSILRDSFCRWDKCEVVLNAPGALLRHMKTVHGPRRINAESPWICQWAGCGYTVIARDDYNQHIEKHAVLPLWCPFKDCTENFRTPRQCIKHKRSDHDSNAVLRRTATPSTVSSQLTTPMSKIPKILPAYMTEFVRPASIPKQRHETLMISVRRRISGNIPAHLQPYNAARPMPMTPSGKNMEPPNNTPYSFLEHRSTRYSSYLSSPARSKNFQPLHSSYVTNLAKRGLVLWPDKDSNVALPEAMMEELEQISMEEEDAVEEELLNEEGFDVFGPTTAIKTSGVGGERSGGDDGEASEHARV